MLHKFFEPGDWFAAKKHGYGSGLPIAWQGWLLMLSYIAVMAGFAYVMDGGDDVTIITACVGMASATGLFLWIAKSRTAGRWRWRNGE